MCFADFARREERPIPPTLAAPRDPARIAEPRFNERIQQDRRLLALYHRDRDTAARDQVVIRFLPLARQLARRYDRGGEPLDDLVQVASLGLLKAIDRFDPTQGNAFSTYAVPTIVGEIKRHFRDKGWLVRVPRGLQELAIRIDRVADSMAGRLGRIPTPAEIAEETGTPLEQILEAREALAARRGVSLDRPRNDDEQDGDSYAEAFGDEDPGYQHVEAAATAQRLARVLDDREREVLRLRFEEDLTQAEIGERVGVSQMHVSRLIRNAIARLRLEAEATESTPPSAHATSRSANRRSAAA